MFHIYNHIIITYNINKSSMDWQGSATRLGRYKFRQSINKTYGVSWSISWVIVKSWPRIYKHVMTSLHWTSSPSGPPLKAFSAKRIDTAFVSRPRWISICIKRMENWITFLRKEIVALPSKNTFVWEFQFQWLIQKFRKGTMREGVLPPAETTKCVILEMRESGALP